MFYGRPQPDVPEPPVRMMSREDRVVVARSLIFALVIAGVIVLMGLLHA